MPGKRVIGISWPSGGLNRKVAMQDQPPFSCAKARNVWTSNVGDLRQSGGSRAGTGVAFPTQLGSGAKVNLLASVDWANSSGGAAYNGDDFEGLYGVSEKWTAPTFLASDGLFGQRSGWAVAEADEQVGGIFTNATIGTASAYTVSTTVRHTSSTSNTGAITKHRIYARMDATTPNAQSSGMYLEVVLTRVSSTQVDASGGLYVDGALSQAISAVQLFGKWSVTRVLSVTISTNTVTANLGSDALLGAGVVIASHGSNTRTGFGLQADSDANTSAYALDFYISGTSTSNTDTGTTVVAASNGQLYKSTNDGAFTTVGAAATLSTSEYLQSAEHTQKLYIANYSLSDAAIVPKVYDPSAGTISTLTASAGTAPTRCKLICRYSDSLMFANQIGSPHSWFLSRKGSPLDWDYTQLALGDNGSAISGALSDASAIGAPITALCPFGDDYLVMGCLDSLWVMRGDPRFGGSIDNISRKVGILDKFAWCRTPEGALLWVSKDGVYALSPGAASLPESISRERLPNELLNIDTLQYDVCMEFDTEFRGAWIFVRDRAGIEQTTSWFVDWEMKSFWPMTYPIGKEAVTAYFVSTPTQRAVLLGCVDGYVRKHSRAFTDDSTAALQSYVEIGPIRLAGSEYDEGVLTELVGAVHYQIGGDVTWTVRTAKNAQALYNDVSGAVDTRTGTFAVGTTGSGLSVKDRQRIRGGAMVLKLEETNGAPWALEGVQAVLKVAGKQRVAS